MKNYLFALILLMLFSPSVFAKSNINAFIGTWSIAYERTIEAVKNSPKYKPGDSLLVSAMVKRLMAKTEIKISDDSFSYSKGHKNASFDIDIDDSSDTTAKVTAYVEGKPFTLTFNIIDDKYMNFKSSGSENMDYLVWERKK